MFEILEHLPYLCFLLAGDIYDLLAGDMYDGNLPLLLLAGERGGATLLKNG